MREKYKMRSMMISAILIALSLTSMTASASPNLTQDAFCLALNIYHEARSKTIAGQIAVANVTLNRVKSEDFPNTICEVIYQKDQFSWYWDGKDDTPREKKAWEIALKVAEAILTPDNAILDNTDGSLYYHADYVKPFWSEIFEPVKKIGPHIFYVDNRS